MNELSLKDLCISNPYYDDGFVGIKCVDNEIKVAFPLGYNIGEDDRSVRKDILLLLNVLSRDTDKKDSPIATNWDKNAKVEYPIKAYLFLIYDYFARGYYQEQDVQYHTAKRGRINWNRTIKTQRPYVQGDEIYYLDFTVKKTFNSQKELITQIHKYCVYESFRMVGRLFTTTMPEKPEIKFNKELFLAVIQDKLASTFIDNDKLLFQNMITVIRSLGDEDAKLNYTFGTHNFEYVWEKIIDGIFGISNKNDFFPKTTWQIKNRRYPNTSLEPDTIMLFDDNVYVLDAKYYKYGWSHSKNDLPDSASINKQITYGEYIAVNEKFRDADGNNPTVYNAFILPYNAKDADATMEFIGTATSEWKGNDKEYENVLGIMLDVKHAMMIYKGKQYSEIENLANLIMESISVN